MKQKAVRWVPSEFRLVAKEIVKHEMQGVTLSQPDKIMKYQYVLPEGRRRPVASAGFCCEFFKQLRAWEPTLRDEIKTEAVTTTVLPAPTPEPVIAVTPAPEPPEPEIIVVERKVLVQPDYGRIPTPTLIRILCERMADMEVQLAAMSKFKELQSEIETRRQNELHYDKRLDTRPVAQQPEHVRATRICVFGLLPTQQQEIEGGSYPKPVQFRFVSKDRSDNHKQEVPSSVDHIILSRFISHSIQDKILASVPREMVSFVDGGVTAIRQKVFDVLSRQ